MSRARGEPFSLKLQGPCEQEGFAHDCLVAGTRKLVGFTFYEIAHFDVLGKAVQGRVSAVVWMPRIGAQELHRQLGEALAQLEVAEEGAIVMVDHMPRKRPLQ